MTPRQLVPRDLARPLDRVTWRDGQLLASRDLRDDQHHADRRRHLHIRYLHRTWGVVEGLEIAVTGSKAVVTPGYALDVEGRELLLPRQAEVPVPANIEVPTTIYLVISYEGTAHSDCGCAADPAVHLAQICPGATTSVTLVHGMLAWKTVGEVRFGKDVLLARVLVSHGQFASEIDTSVKRHAASMAQPKMWHDVTEAGRTGWRTAAVAHVPAMEATVDTSDAGFTATPAYFIRVFPPFHLSMPVIVAAAPDRFTLQVRAVPVSSLAIRSAASGFTPKAAEQAGVVVAWLAVECSSTGVGANL